MSAPPALSDLYHQIENAFAPLGFAPEARPFSPHLTIGRVKQNAGLARLLPRLRELSAAACAGQAFANTLDLMQSHLGPGRARYERIYAARLAAPLE